MGDLINCSWGNPMPFKHVIKVSDRVYEKLQELMKATGANSPNQALETLLNELDHGVTPSADHRVTPLVRVERREDPFWLDVVVGEGYNTEHIALNIIQYEKLCRTGLLPSTLCGSPK
jgi:hypothetical protein